MRAGLGTILQTLTPEAAAVLNQSIGEAARRGHAQTTPLHVAAALLASPSGLLRTACIRSHPTSSHPLQCRALELCFSVALDRLPSFSAGAAPNSDVSASNGAGAAEQPPISNALMAALKRAQANQRRGCPEQQQQPLLAVKVEVEQLVVSILDDPGVSRVMREASFSSPAVKATIEQSFATSASASATTSVSPSPAASTNSLPHGVAGGVSGGLRNRVAPGTPLLPADRSLYLNPLLQQQQGNGRAAASTTLAITSASPSPSVSINSLPLGGGGGVLGGLRGRAAPGTPLLPWDRSLYINPRLQRQQGNATTAGSSSVGFGQQREEAKKVLDVLLRTRRRNPILVGDSHVEVVMKEVLQGIDVAGNGPLRDAEVISLVKQLPTDKSQVPQKLQELANSIDARFKSKAAGVILDVGDLKWLVETPGGAALAVAEMAKLLARFADGGSGGMVWVVGTANSATYLRCHVNHPTMEDDWDLQAVPISPPAPATLVGVLPRAASTGALGSSPDLLTVQRCFPPVGAAAVPARRPPSETADGSRREMCPVCKDSYEHELAKLVAKEFEKSSSDSTAEPRQPLPPWLQHAKLSNGNIKPTATQLQTKEQELLWKQTTEELLKRWTETCSRLHPILTQPAVGPGRPPPTNLQMPSLYNSNFLLRHGAQARMQPTSGGCGPLPASNHGSPATTTSARLPSPPGSPVRTELILGRGKPPPPSVPSTEKPPGKLVGDAVGFAPERFPGNQREMIAVASNLDLDSFKRLFKGLTEKVSWQPEAASSVAATVIQCKSGAGRRRPGTAGSRGDAWLLFFGPDKVGKKKLAVALSETVVGRGPVTVHFGGGDAESDVSSRGKTALDRVVEAVRRDPFSVVVLENVDLTDVLVLGSLRRAMERGRIPDSHGREVSLGSAIFILISDSSPEELSEPLRGMKQCEEKLFAAANSGWQLELALGEKPGKRSAEWLCKDVRPVKPRKQSPAGLSLDLNLAAGSDDDAAESSRNSSDLTVELDHNNCRRLPMLSHPSGSSAAVTELVKAVDEAVTFKPVDFGELRRKVVDAISRKFRAVVGNGGSLCIHDEALDRVVGGVWFGTTPAAVFEEWTERVLVPGFRLLRGRMAAEGGMAARLLAVKDGCTPRGVEGLVKEWLPSRVSVAADGLCGA